MSPKLSERLGEVVFGLASRDVQIFLATHDYVLTSDLSLAVETAETWRAGTAFFALGRRDGQDGVLVERGGVLAELQDNAILEAFAALHEREQRAFQSTGGAGDVDRRG